MCGINVNKAVRALVGHCPAIETLWRSAWVLSQHSPGRSKGTFARKPIPSHPHCILVGHRHTSQRPHPQWRQSFVFLSQIYIFPWPRFVLTFLSNLPVVVPNIQLDVDLSYILQMYLIQHSKPRGSSSPGRRIRYLTQHLSSTYQALRRSFSKRGLVASLPLFNPFVAQVAPSFVFCMYSFISTIVPWSRGGPARLKCFSYLSASWPAAAQVGCEGCSGCRCCTSDKACNNLT